MTIDFSLVRKVPARSELHGVAVTTEQLDEMDGPFDWEVLKSRGFEARQGQVQIVSSTDGTGKVLAAVGVGKAADVDASTMRAAAGSLVKAGRRHKHISTALLDALPEGCDKAAAASAIAEGALLGAYSNALLKSEPKKNEIRSLAVVGTGGAKVTAGLTKGAAIGAAICFARDLVNEPGGSLTPPKFAQEATRIAKRDKLTIKVLDLAAIKKAKLGGLLGVNRGSTIQPRFVEMTYKPKGTAKGSIALVGKGITFDAGGLSIKSGAGMMTMKCDMGGAAAVIGAMSAVAAVAPSVKVTAYVPMTDNMLGGDATRPGDVLKIRNGKTVEVLNTDAEGRLVLADALSLACEAKPDAIVDLATLTGACMVALGPKYAGLMGNNQSWIDQVKAAGESSDEKVWHLPLAPEYRSMLDTPIADLKNIGGAHAGALTAGLFLQEFVSNDIPWVHLDIAGPAWTDADAGLNPKGGTGFGVRMLLDLVENFEKPEKSE